MDHTPEVRQNTTNQTTDTNMKDILALITRLVVALEVMAQSMSGSPTNVIPFTEDADAEETKTPAAKPARGSKPAKPAKEEPKVDYAALREEGDALIKGMAQNKGVPVPELKAIIAKHGAAKFSEASDDKLEAIVADLRARDQIADSEV